MYKWLDQLLQRERLPLHLSRIIRNLDLKNKLILLLRFIVLMCHFHTNDFKSSEFSKHFELPPLNILIGNSKSPICCRMAYEVNLYLFVYQSYTDIFSFSIITLLYHLHFLLCRLLHIRPVLISVPC